MRRLPLVQKTHNFLPMAALLLLPLLPVVKAHGHDVDTPPVDMNMSALLAAHALPSNATPPAWMIENERIWSMPNYFAHHEHRGLMLAHVACMIVAWVVILPLTVMMSIARSRLTLPSQLLFLLLNGVGNLTAFVYNKQVPDLYENNSHHKSAWAVTWIAIAWALLGVVRLYARHPRTRLKASRPALHPVTQQAMAKHQGIHNHNTVRWSGDSGQGTELDTGSLCTSSRTNSENGQLPTRQTYQNVTPEYAAEAEEEEEEEEEPEKLSFLAGRSIGQRSLHRLPAGLALSSVNFCYVLLERTLLMTGFLVIVTGVIVYGGTARAGHVFNSLAHFIKGGIFFWYGLLAFGRWMGCFADLGWAWNVKPGADMVGPKKARVLSAEFCESALICFYGATNVFLEHLGGKPGVWRLPDLEHVAVAGLFFGGGLLGMLIESSRIRKLLDSSLPVVHDSRSVDWDTPKSHSFSLNPIPALVIMLLGIMMSSHTQDSMVSSAMHRYWGTLFVAGALARGLTYITFWLKPPKSHQPSRPPTEIIAAFCLISGGFIFMASNMDTVRALEEHGLMAMFVFSVVMGMTALLMAWEMIVITIKGLIVRREFSGSMLKNHVSSA